MSKASEKYLYDYEFSNDLFMYSGNESHIFSETGTACGFSEDYFFLIFSYNAIISKDNFIYGVEKSSIYEDYPCFPFFVLI